MMVNNVLGSRRRRLCVGVCLALVLLVAWGIRFVPDDYYPTSASGWWTQYKSSSSSGGMRYPPHESRPAAPGQVLPHVDDYFEQVFAPGKRARPFAYAALQAECARSPWRMTEEEVYLRCDGMAAGLTSIVSQVKVCLKMAIETGSSLVLPSMPLRDSTNLLEFNFLNGDAYMTYDRWFDADHLRSVFAKACPHMKIVHPDDLDKTVPVKRRWEVRCADAWGYKKLHSYFWAGRPYRHFFEGQIAALKAREAEEKKQVLSTGITVVNVDAEFLLFRITDDPTRRDLAVWTDLSHAVRFLRESRDIISRLLPKLQRPYYGVHFRVENDSIWTGLDHQLSVDLDALDRAWDMFGKGANGDSGTNRTEKPLVYLACGDKHQVEKFVEAGAARGWEVTHKWRLTEGDEETRRRISALAFDFQGAIDMGIMVRSEFFIGISGSAFSSTIANHRDITGRYRGSSFEVGEDDGARTHLFNDLDADEYQCCL